MRFKKIIALVVLNSALLAYADNNDSNLSTNIDVGNFIANDSTPFPKVKINDSFGSLISESQVGAYKPDSLYKFYRNSICGGVYGFNCKSNIKNLNQYTGVNLEQESGLIGQDFSQINAYKVVYTTQGMDNKEHRVSGAILLPQSDQPLKGVIIFYHFTVLNKDNVPSRFNKDELDLSKTIASTLASDGYAVVMPDYVGLGDDSKTVHPYVIYPVNNALSGIYMLKLLDKIQPSLSYNLVNKKIPLFLSGYSEGGAYSLWAAKILQDNPDYLKRYGYKLTKTVPMEGAYNLSKVTLPFLMESSPKVQAQPFLVGNERIATFAKPALVANVLNSYEYYANPKISESIVFNSKFASCVGCTVNDANYTLPQLIEAPAGEATKYKLIHQAAGEAGYSMKNSSIMPLTTSELLNNPDFLETIEDGDIYNWKATTPISFMTLEYDSIVTRLNAEAAYAAMVAQGSSSLNITVIPNQNFKTKSYIPFSDMNIDHPSGLSFMLLFARNQFDESSPSVPVNH